MNQYAYDALNQEGQSVEGDIEAESVAEAVSQLASQGLNVTSIRLAPHGELTDGNGWLNNLAEVLSDARRWLPAVDAVHNDLPSGPRKLAVSRAITTIRSDVEPHQWLVDAQAARLLPLINSMHQLPQVQAGQVANQFATRVAALYRPHARPWWISYSFLLIAIVSVLILLLSIFVVPVFRDLYSEFGLRLPAPTLLVIWVSNTITEHYWWAGLTIAGVACVGSLAAYFWRRHALTNRLLGRWVAGSSSNLRAMADFTGMLAELLRLDAPTPTALRTAGKHCGHEMFHQAAEDLASGLQGPSSSSGNALISWQLPLSVVHALAAKEGRPSIALLEELSETYRRRAEGQLEWFSSAFPVVAVIFAGIIVGFVVIALLMPMVTLVSALA